MYCSVSKTLKQIKASFFLRGRGTSQKKNYFRLISSKKWHQAAFVIVMGFLFGAATSIANPPTPLGIIPTFFLMSLIMMYGILFFFGGFADQMRPILPHKAKKIVSSKSFLGWIIFTIAWLVIGGWIVINNNSEFLAKSWVYTFLGLFIAYPCIASLTVYVSSFQYLKDSKDDYKKKKTIVNSLLFLTIALAFPWILIILLISYDSLPMWASFIVSLAIYVSIFFCAIDLPYYLSMEETKTKKVNGLKRLREKLIEELCFENRMDRRYAMELNIQRIDRDSQRNKSESSHPYWVLKPIAGFVVVSILANLLVEILKVLLNI
ncbi:MAG: hypothetical protein ACBZ72_08905 [Candidatus Bathyarchaeia archaeon]|jgi:uncharacterized membrane protein YidH (DUF202 family)